MHGTDALFIRFNNKKEKRGRFSRYNKVEIFLINTSQGEKKYIRRQSVNSLLRPIKVNVIF
jgi:hypothetical protein